MASRKPLNQSGDTIVEVLMAILVLGTVLTGAFLLSNRSGSTIQTSQEQAEMNQVLTTQVELLRAMALKGDISIYRTTAPNYFCISDSLDRVEQSSLSSLPNTSVTGYNPECLKDNRYAVAIRYSGSGTNGVFTVDGRWDSIGGGVSKASLTYRIPQ